jgi:hypothetical protein
VTFELQIVKNFPHRSWHHRAAEQQTNPAGLRQCLGRTVGPWQGFDVVRSREMIKKHCTTDQLRSPQPNKVRLISPHFNFKLLHLHHHQHPTTVYTASHAPLTQKKNVFFTLSQSKSFFSSPTTPQWRCRSSRSRSSTTSSCTRPFWTQASAAFCATTVSGCSVSC